jgi:RNA polymerase sigma-70 factor, ECF subfamily
MLFMSASSLASDTSSSLLARIRDQDPDAWIQIVEWIGPFILRWCRRANLQAADCDEVSQQVLINVWRQLGAFHKDRPGDSFRGWVYIITRNCVRDLLARRRGAPGPLPAGLAAEADPAEADDLQKRALRLLIRGAIAKYANDRGFKAFYRTAVDGLTAQQAAQELGLSADVVRQHKSRWIKRLRDRLHEQFGGLLG